MALVEIDKVVDTIITFIEYQRPVFDTIIDTYFENRRLNIFVGRRPSIPASSLPSIEVTPVGDSVKWAFCRVQENNPRIEIDITTDNGHPEQAVRLESRLVTLVTQILAAPPALRAGLVRGYRSLQDSLPEGVTYGTADNGRMRVATVSWTGNILTYLSDEMFSEPLRIGTDW